MNSESWLLQKISLKEVMNEENLSKLWQKNILRSKDERYIYWVNMPSDPSLN
jgi:hypothetical protein